MIDALYKPLANGSDDGIIRELLLDFYRTSKQRKPQQIIVFGNGVSESQLNQVLNIELEQIIKAYQHLGEADIPNFTVIVAQKNHHTKLFQASYPENVPPSLLLPMLLYMLFYLTREHHDQLTTTSCLMRLVSLLMTCRISSTLSRMSGKGVSQQSQLLLPYATPTFLQHKWDNLLSLRIHLIPALPQPEAFLFRSSLGFIRMSRVRCSSAETLWMDFRKYAAGFIQLFGL